MINLWTQSLKCHTFICLYIWWDGNIGLISKDINESVSQDLNCRRLSERLLSVCDKRTSYITTKLFKLLIASPYMGATFATLPSPTYAWIPIRTLFNDRMKKKTQCFSSFYGYQWFSMSIVCRVTSFNTLRPRQNERPFPDDIFKCIFENENVGIVLKISLTFVPKAPINNIPSLVQIMVWRRPGDNPLSEPMMVGLLTHICITRPQWVKTTDETLLVSLHFKSWKLLKSCNCYKHS